MKMREGNIRRYKSGSSSYTVGHAERRCKFLTKNSEVSAFQERRWFSSEKNEMEVWEVFQTSRRERNDGREHFYVEINVRCEFYKFSKRNARNDSVAIERFIEC